MSITVCVGENMTSTLGHVGLAASFYRRVVAETVGTSTRDGDVQRAPDPIPMIATEVAWTNTTGTYQKVHLVARRAARSIVTSSPATVQMEDGIAYGVGLSPQVPAPSGNRGSFATRIRLAADSDRNVPFGRLYTDIPESMWFEDLGTVSPGHTVLVRYRCLLSTPGIWRDAPQPMYQAHARWIRLALLAEPFPLSTPGRTI